VMTEYKKIEGKQEFNFSNKGKQTNVNFVNVKPKARQGGGCGIISSMRDNWSGFGYGMIDELHYYADIPSFTSPPTVIWDRHAPGSGSGSLSFAQEFPNAANDVLIGVAWFGDKIWMYAGGQFAGGNGFLELNFDENILSASFSRLISISGITPTAYQDYIDQYITVPPAGTTINNGAESLGMGQLMGSGTLYAGCGISSTKFAATNGCGGAFESPPGSGQFQGGNQDVIIWDVSGNVPAATMAFKTKGCVVDIVYDPINASFKTGERSQNPMNNWVRHYDFSGTLINESLAPLPNPTHLIRGAFNYDQEFHYSISPVNNPPPFPAYDIWKGITTQSQVGVGGIPNGGNNLEFLATDTSNPNCQAQRISGCMDPDALNYNPLATHDCYGNNLGNPPTLVSYDCCEYPCHKEYSTSISQLIDQTEQQQQTTQQTPQPQQTQQTPTYTPPTTNNTQGGGY